MYSKITLLICLLVSFSPFVSACEGECIVSITKAFLGNYSSPIHDVLKDLAGQISTQLLPPSQRPADPITFMQPIFTAYTNSSYDSLETAIFPSYFHGKCQRFSKDGQDPPGCPNPDCPVVCGTPGSLVHFYPTLRLIAFNDTKTVLEELVSPGNQAYLQMDKMVRDAQMYGARKARARDSVARAAGYDIIDANTTAEPSNDVSGYPHAHTLDRHTHAHIRRFSLRSSKHDPIYHHVRKESSGPTLANILAQIGPMLGAACGGDVNDSTNGLPKCSWETEMKEYILSFP
ncbi:hypothetical protein DFH11DRAFT_1516389 [Phellopilus nigrolimitatus]|nr:hypothetical protein DFH11DRAFT_1516389 [Phellopilus nigrolimitatus]